MKAMLEKSMKNEQELTAKLVGVEQKADTAKLQATSASAAAANTQKAV